MGPISAPPRGERRSRHAAVPGCVLDAVAPGHRRRDTPRILRLPVGSPKPAELLDRAGYPAGACLLESGGAVGPRARWSLLFLEPLASFEAREIAAGEAELRLTTPARGLVHQWIADPLDAIEDLARVLGPSESGSLPITGGIIVSLSHELVRLLEPNSFAYLPAKEPGEPLVRARLYGAAMLHDRRINRTLLAEGRRGGMRPFLRALKTPAGSVEHRLDSTSNPQLSIEPPRSLPAGIRSSLDRDNYLRAVETIQGLIREGETYEVNLTQQLKLTDAPDAAALHRALRLIAPAPFSAYADLPGATIVSSSPERLVRMRGRHVESRPIKGTRPRNRMADRVMLRELLRSDKDRAENIMICDLVRNDLGRIAEPGTVRVERLCRPERHALVHHLVSTVIAKHRKDVGSADLLRAIFPPGSMTGAPKIRTCQIIDELEPVARGPYGGALGYIASHGDVDFSVVIRALVQRLGRTELGVGGAVTVDSEPMEEYSESLVKARGGIAAVEAACASPRTRK
ncbi:MAG: hypothetical protein CME06_01960 [Gemmatimonadetes bacterium]|nr:hypothetical protein [Gemmatimonadota bacterium]